MKNMMRNTKGVTLIELLVVLAIIGILALLTLPNIPAIIAGHRLRTSANDVLSKLRSVRSLAISKGRTLELEMDTTAQTFTVTRLEHTEYNLVGTVDDQDFVSAIADGDDLTGFILFSETEESIHMLPIWNSDGTPDYNVPINFDVQSTLTYNGIETLTMTPSTKLTFNAEGTLDENVTITLTGPARYGSGTFEIVTYKGGQIKIK